MSEEKHKQSDNQNLPMGEDPRESNERKLRLLKRTLIEKRSEYYGSIRSAGNELLSNVPTFITVGSKGDAGYVVAAALGLAIAGIIGYRGNTQKKEYKRALQIWSAFERDSEQDLEQAFEAMANSMQEEGLLFEGIPKHNLQHFRDTEHRMAAQKYGILNKDGNTSDEKSEHGFSDADIRTIEKRGLVGALEILALKAYTSSPKDIVQAVAPRVENAQAKYAHGVDVLAEYVADQIKDGGKNVTKATTYTNIAKGFRAAAVGLRDYEVFSHRARKSKRIRGSHPDLAGTLIEEESLAYEVVDREKLERVSIIRNDLRRHHKDGKLLTTAFGCETGFFAAHAYEANHAIQDGDWWNLAVSSYSIMMASGAYSYLGREVSAILDAVQGRRGRLAEAHHDAEAQYGERILSQG